MGTETRCNVQPEDLRLTENRNAKTHLKTHYVKLASKIIFLYQLLSIIICIITNFYTVTLANHFKLFIH